jgi:hypothetical protein
MKKIVTLSLITATSLMAMYGEHAYLYKDPRIMGMGGANVAVGSYSTSVFSNPAGLTNIEKEHGFVVDLLGLGVSGSKSALDFAEDLQDAIDTEEDAEVAKVLKEYSGEHFHVGVDNYTSISKNSDVFAWSIGLLAAADVNFMPHAQGSTTGGLLQTSSRAYGGIVLGAAKPFDTELGRVDVGVGVKYISQMSYEGVLGVSELLEDGEDNDLADTLQDKYEKESSAIGLDLGVMYHPFSDSYWNPTFGLSIMNIGMEMDKNYGYQPITVNVGASVTPDVAFLDKLVLAVDYTDILNGNKVRTYKFSETDEVIYSDHEESDYMKRLRLGVSATLLDTWAFSTTLNAGMYQGAYTAGVNLELFFLKLNAATYEEQIGTGDVDIADRRYMVQLGIGW